VTDAAAPGFRIDWASPAGVLLALEPRLDEVAAHADALAAAYNDPRNATLMGHESVISPTEVVDHYEAMQAEGARPFLLYVDGAFAGDADLRGLTSASGGGAAEFAFMVASPAAQGRGLGTRFAVMIHAFAFQSLALDHVYASVVPANTASRRVFDKLGYRLDGSLAARAFAETPDDLTLSIDRATFEGLHLPELAEIRVAMR
jgi:RimJ/RimL family protein N-acetyltransferase